MVIGVAGLGMMGSAVAGHLHDRGFRVVAALDGRSAATVDRAAQTGVVNVGSLDDLIAESDLVLSIMGSRAATDFIRQFEKSIARVGPSELVFADCNLIEPLVITRSSEALTGMGVRFVDAAIVGPPPNGTTFPRIYVSGPDALELAFLGEQGFIVTNVGAEVGMASALKVYSAGIWQGCLALMLETLVAAYASGVGEQLSKDLGLHQELLYTWFTPAALDAPPRAARWAGDMDVVAATMRSAGANGDFHQGAAEVMARLASVPPREWSSGTEIAQALVGRT